MTRLAHFTLRHTCQATWKLLKRLSTSTSQVTDSCQKDHRLTPCMAADTGATQADGKNWDQATGNR